MIWNKQEQERQYQTYKDDSQILIIICRVAKTRIGSKYNIDDYMFVPKTMELHSDGRTVLPR